MTSKSSHLKDQIGNMIKSQNANNAVIDVESFTDKPNSVLIITDIEFRTSTMKENRQFLGFSEEMPSWQ